ncbi:hypothetical protein [Sporocytophaga myxococcoides]|uniref:hypothetical protein n=1 Tax=Sporocytophaga myxococcoides TaxID=153721 RepID=UPI00040C4956|nr:hypothetical protein [Sporocytophaga myxococcoides]
MKNGGREIKEGKVILFPIHDSNEETAYRISFHASDLKRTLIHDYYKLYNSYRLYWGVNETTYFFFRDQKKLFLYEHPGCITHINLNTIPLQTGPYHPLMINNVLFNYYSTLEKGMNSICFSFNEIHSDEINEKLYECTSIHNISKFGKTEISEGQLVISLANISEKDYGCILNSIQEDYIRIIS